MPGGPAAGPARSPAAGAVYQLVDEPDPDLEATADTLLTIWQRTL